MRSTPSWPVGPDCPELEQTDVHVWYAKCGLADGKEEQAARMLSAAERARAARFHFDGDRRRFIAAHAILRSVLGRYLSVAPDALEFVSSQAGKPVLQLETGSRDLRFSLARSGEDVLVAVADGRDVGVDLEVMQPDVDVLALAQEVFSDHMCAALHALSGETRKRAFYQTWTRLEAYLKARGTGFSIDPRQIHIPLDAISPVPMDVPDHGGDTTSGWTIVDLAPAAGVAAAVAAEGDDWRPVCLSM